MVRVQDLCCSLWGVQYSVVASFCRCRGTCPFRHAGNVSEVTKTWPCDIFTYSEDNNSRRIFAGHLQCPPPRSHILCHRYPAPGRTDISFPGLKDKPLCWPQLCTEPLFLLSNNVFSLLRRMNARKSPVFVRGDKCSRLYRNRCLHVGGQLRALAGIVFVFQVQEPASEDEYEVCDRDDGAYEIQCEVFYSPH